jgi:hypothetical protein
MLGGWFFEHLKQRTKRFYNNIVVRGSSRYKTMHQQ